MLAERGRRRVDAWAAMRKGKGSERHTAVAVRSVAVFMAMGNLPAREVSVSHRLGHGTFARRRYMARLQKALPFVRRAREHDFAQDLGLARPVGVSLLIGLLDHVGPLKQRP